jgi:hypothetical protein
MTMLGRGVHVVFRWFNSLDRQEWLIVLTVGMLFGLLCMRGFGSRENY